MHIRRTVNFTLGLLLLIPTVALANCKDSKELPPNTNGRSGGSRGCSTQKTSSDSIPALILLAPSRGDAKVISTRPTFAWLVNDPGTWQMEFRLYEYDRRSYEPKLVAEIKDANFKSYPGIVVLSPSQSIPELAVAKSYLWQVELICDPLHPSGNPFAEAEIEVVETSPDLKAQLAKTNLASKQASLYSQSGLWYDALSIVLTQQNPQIAQLNSLLDQVATSNKEKEKLRESAIHRIQR